MEKAFVYGMSVGGNNFTDRIEETKRIKLDFEKWHQCYSHFSTTHGKNFAYKKSYFGDRQSDA